VSAGLDRDPFHRKNKEIHMMKLKLLAGLAIAAGIVAMSVAPAGATFKSLLATKEHVKLQTMTFTFGGLKVICQAASGEWHLQTKGKFEETEHKTGKTEDDKQVATLSGPHLYIAVSEWSKCTGEAVGLFKVPATVEPCELQVEQPHKGATTGTVSLVTACVLKTTEQLACTITLSAGKEAKGTNAFLNEMNLESTGEFNFLLMSPKIEGINGTATCKELEKFNNGKLTGEPGSIIPEGGLELG
jgi:hypothetical protein